MKEKVFKIPYESEDDIPLSEYKNLHKQYWEFIAENKLHRMPHIVSKSTYQPLQILDSDFACAYAFKLLSMYGFKQILCSLCPVKLWHSKASNTIIRWKCLHRPSYYLRWKSIFEIHKNKIAHKIANLEWED